MSSTPSPHHCRSPRTLRRRHAPAAMAGCRRFLHGVARHHHSQHRRPRHLRSSQRHATQHEGRAGQLHAQPRGVHSHQRLDGRQIRHPPRVCLRHRHLHPRLFSLRHLHQHSYAGGIPRRAGHGRRHDGPGGPPHPGQNIPQVRPRPHHELRLHSRAHRPHAGPGRRRPHRRLLPLARDLLSEHPHRHHRPRHGLPPPAQLR